MTADPYKASAGAADPGSWNRYSYVEGDPTNFGDSSGLLKENCGPGWASDASLSGPCDFNGGSAEGGPPRPWSLWGPDIWIRNPTHGYWLGNGHGEIWLPDESLSQMDLKEIEDIVQAVPQLRAGRIVLVLGAAALYDLYQWYKARPKIQPSDCPKDQREATPSEPGNVKFGPVRGEPCKVNPATGEIWCQDPSEHADPHFEVYKTRRDYEKGKRNRAVWNNGCIRQQF